MEETVCVSAIKPAAMNRVFVVIISAFIQIAKSDSQPKKQVSDLFIFLVWKQVETCPGWQHPISSPHSVMQFWLRLSWPLTISTVWIWSIIKSCLSSWLTEKHCDLLIKMIIYFYDYLPVQNSYFHTLLINMAFCISEVALCQNQITRTCSPAINKANKILKHAESVEGTDCFIQVSLISFLLLIWFATMLCTGIHTPFSLLFILILLLHRYSYCFLL